MPVKNIRDASVLVVQHDDKLREALKSLLQKARYTRVLTERTAEEAFKVMKRAKIDALVVENSLNSEEFLTELRNKFGNVPAVVVDDIMKQPGNNSSERILELLDGLMSLRPQQQ